MGQTASARIDTLPRKTEPVFLPSLFMISDKETKYFDRLTAIDNCAIARIERATERRDAKAIAREERRWEKECEREQKRVEKEEKW